MKPGTGPVRLSAAMPVDDGLRSQKFTGPPTARSRRLTAHVKDPLEIASGTASGGGAPAFSSCDTCLAPRPRYTSNHSRPRVLRCAPDHHRRRHRRHMAPRHRRLGSDRGHRDRTHLPALTERAASHRAIPRAGLMEHHHPLLNESAPRTSHPSSPAQASSSPVYAPPPDPPIRSGKRIMARSACSEAPQDDVVVQSEQGVDMPAFQGSGAAGVANRLCAAQSVAQGLDVDAGPPPRRTALWRSSG